MKYGSAVAGSAASELNLVLHGLDLEEIPIGQFVDLEEAPRRSTIPFLAEALDCVRLPESIRREFERDCFILVPAEWWGKCIIEGLVRRHFKLSL